MGASRLLVRFTVLISPFCRSSFEEEIAIWVDDGEPERALLMRVPPPGGDAPLFDISDSVEGVEIQSQGLLQNSSKLGLRSPTAFLQILLQPPSQLVRTFSPGFRA